MELYNKLSAKQRTVLIEKAGGKRLTLSFYKYCKIKNPKFFRDYLYLKWNELDILGRIYVAKEGINAQLSLPSNKLKIFKKSLDEIKFLNDVRLNIAIEHNNHSFLKLKIKLREKIVSDGLDSFEVDQKNAGKHLDAKQFNDMVQDHKTLLIDMRNHYESEIGHFKGAILPNVDSFRESLPIINKTFKEYQTSKNIVMYCTGGIRCEKASAFLKNNGYKNVFQLEGGIIEYTRQVKEKGLENKFVGKNFVFDHRRSESVSKEIISNCHLCGKKCDSHVNCANEACHLLFIQCEQCSDLYNNCCSENCKKINSLPLAEQKKLRKGKHNSNKIFKKGRSKVLKHKKISI